MSEAAKKYRAKLGSGHSEEWTQAEHDSVKKALGRRFDEYTVEDIQPEKPADVKQPATAAAEKPAKNATAAA